RRQTTTALFGTAADDGAPVSGPSAASFTRLVSRGASFVSRITKDKVTFTVTDGVLELNVNGVFSKQVSILRIRSASAEVFDQDGWSAAVPHHQFARLEEKLRGLAYCAAVPFLGILGPAQDAGSLRTSGVLLEMTA
ncbi:unnamed protein product, partial [Polarella glacialis]